MSITSINDNMWDGILKVQSEAYSQIEPESLDVLKSKWYRSPSCCFVYQEKGDVLGYLLAHSWNSETPPKLFKVLPPGTEGSILFLHDLAISKRASGKGLGSQMVKHLLNIAPTSDFDQVMLVSVQESVLFWLGLGFSEITNKKACDSYGEGAKIMRL